MPKNSHTAAAPVLDGVSTLKAVEGYNKGLLLIRQGRLEEAVLALLESIFYAPDNTNPIVALAEVYVFLSDLQSAVHQYRRAVWVLTRRERAARRTAAKQAAAEAREAYLASHVPQLMLHSDQPVSGGAEPSTVAAAFASPVLRSREAAAPAAAAAGAAVSIPDTTAVGVEKGRETAFHSDDGVRLTAVQVRLAALLDALGLSLFRMNNFAQAHRCCEDALEVLNDVVTAAKSAASPPSPKELGAHGLRTGATTSVVGSRGTTGPSSSSSDLLQRIHEELVPTLELHRCVYLIALRREEEAERREEEAERRLVEHHKAHPDYSAQSSALLIQLFVNRQAFRSGRELLEKHGSAAIRQERVLTVAQHIFNDKYRQYRSSALARKDLGTISQCIEVYPSDTELLYARALIFIERGELKRSVRDLFQCIKESNSTHKAAVNTMTEVLIAMGEENSSKHRTVAERDPFRNGASDDGDDADDVNAGGQKSVEEAIVYYSESLKWRADNTSVILARADCYMRLEDYENALLDYRKILQLKPDDPVASQRVAFLHDVWGQKLYAQGKVREAETEFTNAIKTDDQVALFYYHRALCRFELNEPRYGLRDVLSCQQLNPRDPALRAFIIRYLGSDQVPTTTTTTTATAAARSGDAPRPAAAATEVQAGARRRAAALYGQPSARIALQEDDAAGSSLGIVSGGQVRLQGKPRPTPKGACPSPQ